jgi:hypothetical protein
MTRTTDSNAIAAANKPTSGSTSGSIFRLIVIIETELVAILAITLGLIGGRYMAFDLMAVALGYIALIPISLVVYGAENRIKAVAVLIGALTAIYGLLVLLAHFDIYGLAGLVARIATTP